MLDYENTTFTAMENTLTAWSEAKSALEQRKKDIIKTYGWDSDELNAWYAEDKNCSTPYTAGAMKAYWAFRRSCQKQNTFFEMEDSLWDDEVRDFVNTLREAGITEFVVTSRSSGLMEDLYAYTAEGCAMQGLYNETRRESRFGEVSEEIIFGIRFTVNAKEGA